MTTISHCVWDASVFGSRVPCDWGMTESANHMEPEISKQGRRRTVKSNCRKYKIYSEEMETGRFCNTDIDHARC